MSHSQRLTMPFVRRSAGLLFVAIGTVQLAADEVAWKRVQLDGVFRSEGVAAGDVNRDGLIDVLAGDVWYEAPGWTMHEIRPVGDYDPNSGYSNSFGHYTFDINRDGWLDYISIGFPGEPFYWYENPRNQPGHWKEHLIWHSACNESPDFLDLTGDGTPELILGSQPESQMGYLPIPPVDAVTAKWKFHALSRPGDPAKNGTHRYYHGLGVGDLNRDGRDDVLIPHGWWQAPAKRSESPWEFHEYALLPEGTDQPPPSADLHVEDLDLDGDNDIMMSSAHRFGIWWFENLGDEPAARFRGHLIDDSYSQTHALTFVDINGDGTRDLVTGKRYYAHNGNDPGGKDPVVMYWYELKRTEGAAPEFVAHEIVEGRDTGIGTQFLVTDVNGDKRPDVVLSNKKGVNLLLVR